LNKKQILGAMLALSLSALHLYSQSVFGEIRGTIMDQSMAVVTEAKVTATNKETADKREVMSDASGNYAFVNMVAGTYEVEVEKAGFASTKTANIRLRARDVVRVDSTLAVAAVGQQVQVTEARQIIATELATIVDTRSNQDIQNLAAGFRAGSTNTVYNSIAFAPGVQSDRSSGTPSFSIGGGMPFQSTASVDGVSSINVRSNGINTEMFPSTESVAELKISAISNNAEYAQAGDITVTSRSGTNQFHGSAYWYHQNGAFDARDFFANRIGAPFKISNDYGFSLGGPVIKNKTFFFGDFEGLKYRIQSVLSSTVPPAAWRTGDLSSITTAIVDPTTGTPYANNQIPVGNAARALINGLFPAQNVAGNSIASANYRLTSGAANNNDQWDLKIDHAFNSKHNVFGRFSSKDITRSAPQGLYTTIGDERVSLDPRNLAFAWNFIVAANKVNEFRFGYANQTTTTTFGPNGQPFDGAALVKAAGIQGIRSDLPAGAKMPDVGITGLTGASHGRESNVLTNTYQFADNFTWVKGRHSMKFGADIRRLRTTDITSFTSGDDLGTYRFDGFFTGNPFADFLIGLPHNTNVANTGKDVDGLTNHYGFFAQDDFRVNPRLTLNYGVRYELHPMFFDRALTTSQFDRAFPGGRVIIANEDARKYTSPTFVQSIGNTPIVTAAQAGLPETLRYNDYNNFAPRFGFAYRLNDKTVLRGGYGIYTATILGSVFYTITGIHVSDVRGFTNTDKTKPNVTLLNPFGGAGVAPVVGSADFRRATQFDGADPYSQQWNLTFERDLGWNTGIRMTYTGNRTIKMFSSPDLNQVRPNTVGYAVAKLARPYPNWNIIYTRDPNTGAWYNAFTTEVNKRMSKGLMFQSSWTWAKNQSNAVGSNGSGFASENGTVPTDRFNLNLDSGNLPTTRRHRFLTVFAYQIPVMASLNKGVGKQVLGGWELGGILLFQSGPFLTPTISSATDPSGTNTTQRANDRPDYATGYTGNYGNLSGGQTVDQWFDRSAFSIPASNIGRFGYVGPGQLVGPGTQSFSLRITKRFELMERYKLQLEGLATNLTNTPNFGNPALNVSASSFGRVTSTLGVDNGGARTIQVGAKVQF
jgi:hypothetical protein